VETECPCNSSETIELGSVRTDQPETHLLTTKPGQSGWQAVNLSSVTLTP
jgi:hypothetical protein